MHKSDSAKTWQRIECLNSVKALPPQGLSYLRTAIDLGPSRKVGAGSLHSLSGATSVDNGEVVGYESESGEETYVMLCLLEHAPLVLSQAPILKVHAYDRRGRRQYRNQRPDYLVVDKNYVRLVEVKPLAKLQQMQSICPIDWQVADGNWSYLPGVNSAAEMGMEHHIFYPESLSPQYRANLRYLVASQKNKQPIIPPQRLVREIKDLLHERPRTIRQILEHYVDISSDDLLHLVADKEIYGLLHHQTLSPDFVLYGSEEQRDLHRMQIESFRLKEVDAGSLTHRLVSATPKELDHALQTLKRYRSRREQELPMDARDYRNRAGIQAAITEGAPPIAGLVPRFSDRGGQGTPLKDADIAALVEYLTAYLKQVKRSPSASEVHANLLIEWAGTGKHIPCIETIRKYLANHFSRERMAGLIGGPRTIHRTERKTPGEACNERLTFGGMWAQCDAVYSDIVPKQIDEREWSVTRPIVFPLVMSASQYIASAGVLFGKPSSLGFLMSVRLCIQAHGWLPIKIFHDRGSEFDANVWDEAAAILGIDKTRRPTADSKSGGEVEMVNGQLNKFLQTLPGGTFHDQTGRNADARQKGRFTAAYNLETILDGIDSWIDAWNNTRHGDKDRTPKQQFDDELHAFPSSVRPIIFNEMVHYQTSYPIIAKKISYERGLFFAGKKYSCDALSQLIHHGERPSSFRLDCLDPSLIRTKSSQGIIRLASNDFHRIAGMGRTQRILAMAERMQYHVKAKRNQSEYGVALAKSRRDLAAAAELKEQLVDSPISASKPPARRTPSFASLTIERRPKLGAIPQ